MVLMLCGMARTWSEWCRWPGLVLPSMDWCCARAGVSAWSCTWLWSGRCRCQQVLSGLVWCWCVACLALTWLVPCRCWCVACLALTWLVPCRC
ncbi:hypothetical protein I3760_05G154200 [Carya illinoinensis]|nr:hypothetical protein I3760_05G154200 [Carya illinoinensis]